jgi:hypothetical protein
MPWDLGRLNEVVHLEWLAEQLAQNVHLGKSSFCRSGMGKRQSPQLVWSSVLASQMFEAVSPVFQILPNAKVLQVQDRAASHQPGDEDGKVKPLSWEQEDRW